MSISEDFVEEKENDDDFYSNNDLYNINSWGADLSFRELINMYEEEELLKPELQRKYVWDKTEASRFIESLLMGLPVPSIFLSKVDDDKKLIIDGYQRIMTVYDYVKRGIFTKDNTLFKLSNSKRINEKWRGKSFKELSQEEQRRIRSTTIHAIIFEQKTPKNDTSLYQIFERINTSGRSLTAQEIRNCIYQGKFNDLLFELNKNYKWRELFGDKEEDSRMKDIESILRYFSLKKDNIPKDKIQISLKSQLNDIMYKFNNLKNENLENYKKEFERVIDYIYVNIGSNAFHNISAKTGEVIERFNPNIFDSISLATLYMLENNEEKNKYDDLYIKRIALLNDIKFKEYISERTTNVENINGRINKAMNYLFGMNYE